MVDTEVPSVLLLRPGLFLVQEAAMKSERQEFGWLYKDEMGHALYYVCDGCNVKEPHEHKCHGKDGGLECDCLQCGEDCGDVILRTR